ncbi:MAG: hypothetical protein J6P16_05875 [Eubacterium sp.]|nr:hypothetical protein [Eubacterium sp.]
MNQAFILPVGEGHISSADSFSVRISDIKELKDALASDENLMIRLDKTIHVRKTLDVRGKKTLTGSGSIKRAVTDNSAFGGSLLRVSSGTLTLKNISINGSSDAASLDKRLYGWLVQVDGGSLVIGEGTVLCNNKNTTRLSDGGGAVCIRGGSCTLDGGVISGNTCVSGGGGVRIETGGAFYMRSGQIKDNKTVGISSKEGFDGRGGGILNKGVCGLYGGSMVSNSVSGKVSEGRAYGGVGGGIANFGSLLIGGVSIRGNKGDRGDDVAAVSGKLAMSGSVSVGEVWLRTGMRLYLDRNVSVNGRISIVPEMIKAGVKIAEGIQGKDWKKLFSFGDLLGEDITPTVKNGILMLIKKTVNTEPPTNTEACAPTKEPDKPSDTDDGAEDAVMAAPGDMMTPHPVNKTFPSYIPVRTMDPEAEIILITPTPEATAAAPVYTPYFTKYPQITPHVTAGTDDTIHTVPEADEAPAPERTLPLYLLYPESTHETESITYYFTADDIKRLKEQINSDYFCDDETGGSFINTLKKYKR